MRRYSPFTTSSPAFTLAPRTKQRSTPVSLARVVLWRNTPIPSPP